jgi:hypothetical protein
MEVKKKDIQKDTLKPVTEVNSQLDKELQEWEVESTESGWWGKIYTAILIGVVILCVDLQLLWVVLCPLHPPPHTL